MDANKKSSERCPLIRKGKHRVLSFVFFVLYFIVLFYLLFFSEEMGRTYTEREYHYNLMPFHEIRRFITYSKVLGFKAVILNLVGNIAAFMPFGSFLPIYTKRCRNVWYTVFYSFELSLLVEILQLVFKVGSFDVDDLLLNTLGGLLGFLVYKAVMHAWKRKQSE